METELEHHKLSVEIEMLRAMERVREQEREHLQKWADDLKERYRIEKQTLEERVAILEGGRTTGTGSPTSASSRGRTAGPTSTVSGTLGASVGGTVFPPDPSTATGGSTVAAGATTSTCSTTMTGTPTTALTTVRGGGTGVLLQYVTPNLVLTGSAH